MHKIYLIPVLLNVLLIPGSFTTSLVIRPVNEIFPYGSNVTVNCTYNGTLVTSSWTAVWLDGDRRPEHLGTMEYVVIKKKANFTEVLVTCKYQDIDMERTIVIFEDDIPKPDVICTSLSQNAYKCEWGSIPSARRYKFEHRSDLYSDGWKVVKVQNDTEKGIKWVYVGRVSGSKSNQTIRVTATNFVSQKSTILNFDIILNLKPNITYMPEKSQMTATSATLVWDTYNVDIGYKVESEYKYKEETNEEDGESITLPKLNEGSDPNQFTINNLQPATDYIFYFRSRYYRPGTNFTDWKQVKNRTKDSRPTETVQGLNYHKDNDGVLLVWQAVPQEHQNGNILGYTIYVIEVDGRNSNMTLANVTDVNYSLKDIQYEVGYNVCVTAYNSAGYSPMKCMIMQMEEELREKLPPQSKDVKDAYMIGIVLSISLIAMGLLAFICKKLKKMEFFIKFPDPKFTQIAFEESFLPPTEKEVFDKLRCMSDDDTTPVVANVTINDSLRLIENKSYLKFLRSDNKKDEDGVVDDDLMVTDDTSYSEFPLSYHLSRGIETEIPAQSLSESDGYLQIGSTMVISEKEKNKSNLKKENDTYCQGPPKISDNGYIIQDQSSDLDCTEYITIVNTSLDKQRDVINHDNYVPITNEVFPKIISNSHQFTNSATSYVPVPVI